MQTCFEESRMNEEEDELDVLETRLKFSMKDNVDVDRKDVEDETDWWDSKGARGTKENLEAECQNYVLLRCKLLEIHVKSKQNGERELSKVESDQLHRPENL